ncbi:hypothetical protein M9H77_35592 [Catharanthus roseus]|uniref:Uncharacterized protein n=1 Tax=Catharanthus roseus TaxID=4058 RepID=A0ACB9ZRL5_CATRO|nr:hypothetical protein M9H77_35592 [Catharanthus roseus]
MIHNQRNIEPNEIILSKNRKTISEIFRISCVVWYKKLVEIESKFYYANCSKDVDYPKLRYMLKVLASDITGSAWFVLFDKEVEKVIGNDIKKIVELYLKQAIL